MDSLSDIALLQRWRTGKDAHAFNILAQRYGGLVFGICNRVLKNGADAEEVTQECFLKLATHTRPPERALAPWLHSVAVRSSLNHIRSESRRRHREAAFEAERAAGELVRAQEIIEHVDEAIAALPSPLGHCLVASFLEGKSQGEVARELGVSVRTVRRKTDEAIGKVREHLANQGIVASTGGLGIILSGLNAEALPPALGIALGKLAVAGNTTADQVSIRAVAEQTTIKGGITMKQLILVLAGISIVAGGMIWMGRTPIPSADAVDTSMVVAQRTAPTTVAAPSPATEPAEVVPVATAARVSASSSPERQAIADIPTLTEPAEYGEVTGVVEDQSGQAIPGARVSALVAGFMPDESNRFALEGFPPVVDNIPGPLATQRPYRVLESALSAPGHQFDGYTDDTGSYRLSAIPYRGTTRVFAEADGFAPMMKHTELSVADAQTVHFALRSARPLRGRILGPLGGGIEGARVAVTGTRSQGGGGGSSRSPLPKPFWTQSDDAGYFTLWVADAEWATLIVHSDTHGKGAFHDVPVGTEEPVPLPLTARMGGLRGQLLLSNSKPAPGYYVHISGAVHRTDTPESGEGLRFALDGSRFEIQTDAEGFFELTPIPTNEDYEAAIYDETGRKVDDSALPVLLPKTLTPWTHRIDAPEYIRGRVVAEDTGEGMEDVLVRAIFASDLGHPGLDIDHTKTAEDGTFSLPLYQGAGEYLVQATTDFRAGVTHNPKLYETVVVNRGKPANITIALPARWARTFRVLDPMGAPIPDVGITLSQSSYQGGSQGMLRDQATDALGLFHYEQLDGNSASTFTFHKEGFLAVESETRRAADTAEPIEEIITLYPAATATLRLLDSTGHPLADTKLFVTAVFGNGEQRSIDVTCDGDGWIILQDWLPATVVDLSLRLPGDRSADGTVRFVGGNSPPSIAMRERMAALSVETALEQQTPAAHLEGLSLSAGMETDLGEVRLESPSEPSSGQ